MSSFSEIVMYIVIPSTVVLLGGMMLYLHLGELQNKKNAQEAYGKVKPLLPDSNFKVGGALPLDFSSPANLAVTKIDIEIGNYVYVKVTGNLVLLPPGKGFVLNVLQEYRNTTSMRYHYHHDRRVSFTWKNPKDETQVAYDLSIGDVEIKRSLLNDLDRRIVSLDTVSVEVVIDQVTGVTA